MFRALVNFVVVFADPAFISYVVIRTFYVYAAELKRYQKHLLLTVLCSVNCHIYVYEIFSVFFTYRFVLLNS